MLGALFEKSRIHSDFYDRRNNLIQNGQGFKEFENNKMEKSMVKDNNSNTCEAISCFKTANSRIEIDLKSGNKVFFYLCSFCKEILQQELCMVKA